MATFGNPGPSQRDATNAVACPQALAAAIDQWNAHSEGDEPIRVGVGVHFGAVAVGDVGDAQRHHRSVFGDVVNVASRLQRLTRCLGATIVASDAVISRAIYPHPLNPHGSVCLPGRTAPVEVWVGPSLTILFQPAAGNAAEAFLDSNAGPRASHSAPGEQERVVAESR
ncbi:MAG: adenylate/guanylate cyclase domain-containing protein [Devosia sp.]